jgi:hypothetical protein
MYAGENVSLFRNLGSRTDACRPLMMVVLWLLRRWLRFAMWRSCLLSYSAACISFFCAAPRLSRRHFITITISPYLYYRLCVICPTAVPILRRFR